MWAVTIEQQGAPAMLGWAQQPDPNPAPGEVRIAVTASAVNRADLLQAAGQLPGAAGRVPDPGDGMLRSDHRDRRRGHRLERRGPGLRPAGRRWVRRDRRSRPDSCCRCPAGVDLLHAAGLPEVACTVWSNLVMTAGLRAGQTVLIHGGGSGIGTMAIQVAHQLGATVVVTASRQDALQACRELGADHGINYAEQDFVTEITTLTEGRGVDVILDVVGAKYLQRNIDALADGGRLVIIGMQGGTRAELDINSLLRKRAGVLATALRSRPPTGPGSKAEIVQQVRERLWPMIEAGRVRPVIDTVLDMPQAGQAHRRLAAGGHIGKIVLRVPTDETPESRIRSEEQGL